MPGRHDTDTRGPHVTVRPEPPAQPSLLPDWMRNPPPPRVTLGDRVTATLLRVPGAPGIRRAWWTWRDRQRLHERFPNSFKIVAFFVSWTLALVLLLGAYGLVALL
ncbi:hypothetical protein [Micromonospora sp. NPDC023956]|uniref:hypothetical protein n=1 Tax=Micromonospora sp. NPDC023956 TaxID=3155722 RepID=UPI0033DADDB4